MEVKRRFEKNTPTFDAKKVLATTLAGFIIADGLTVVGVMKNQYQKNTYYCEGTGKEVTPTFMEYISSGPRTDTIFVDGKAFGSMDEKTAYFTAADINEKESPAEDSKDFSDKNYDNWLSYVAECEKEDLNSTDFLDFVLEKRNEARR